MPHPNAPLSYDPLKAVLKHMDPNQRALLVTKCPSLKTPDSKVPQRIQSLCVGPARITINNTTYQLGVVRQYREGAVLPERHAMVNSRGGEYWDLDKYGINIATPKLTPGDFPVFVTKPAPEEVVRNQCQNIILKMKQKHKLDERKQKKKSMEVIAKLRRNRERSERIATLKETDEAIAEAEAEILPFQLRIDNNEKDIPFTLYLQLTISTNGPDGRRIQSIERVEYNKNLGPATKYLIRRLLRKPMNYVNGLRISPFGNRDCFWLPAEMKLAARHLVVDEPQYVWRILGKFVYRINHPRRFQTLAFNHRYCQKYVNFINVIDRWIINGKPIGTWYTFYTDLKEGAIWYNRMRQRQGSTVVKTPTRRFICFPNCVIVPLPNNAQLEFYITKTKGHPYPAQLHLEVQPRKKYLN